ncbi:MAG: AAA family ATPase [Defluviitaleaceae bacterium]|nr:AAA family ATPase [Defluviitaleaceae bacterium]MCL2263616.1 AAA family ATPase [Defluviitaleaceae bacterium]
MQSENEKLTTVKDHILEKIGTLGESLAAKRTGVLDVRKEMWREARIVLRDFDDVADLTIFAEEVARHETQYVQASEEIKKLGKMMESPYFARIDFAEGGDSEEIYIGRYSLFDDATHTFHVYDWRAPISSLYYDYGTGAASFTVPGTGAVISGEITLKRQYQIENGKLLYMFDNEIAIEDDILRLELSKASEARIKTIINTIQADQNQAIRAEAGTLLVYGPAGCGKTSVGLHRLAYLLYRYRDSLSSSKVRIFSPNEIFSSYIAGIIPALGEEDVQTLDFHTLLGTVGKKSRSGRGFRGQEQMLEAISENLDETRINWLKVKFSAEFLSAIEEYISSYAPVFEDVFFYNDKICNRERLESLYSDRTVSGTLASKTERVISYATQNYNAYLQTNMKKIADLFNSIDDENYSDGIIRAKFEEEKNISMADIRNRSFPRAHKILEKCLKRVASRVGLPFSAARDGLRMDSLFHEDALLLFYIDLLNGRIPPEKTVKHILLDEAQDFSILHHKILQKLYPASQFTVLADTNQALFPEININETNELCEIYPQAQVIPLTKSYRSTYEIMSFAASLLNPLAHDGGTSADSAIFLRHGDEPVFLTTPDPSQAALKILSELPDDFNTVGILLPTISEAKAFYSQFKKLLPTGNTPRPLSLIGAESQISAKGIMVMAASFAKGLEFDAVICPAFAHPKTTREQKLFYLICTRALHKLFLLEHAA